MQDLRSTLDDDFDSGEELADIPIDFDEIEAQQATANQAPPPKFLGMTAGERAFLSMMVFFIALIFGAAILAVTGRIVI